MPAITLTLYPNPLDAECLLTHDSDQTHPVKGFITKDAAGRDCQMFVIGPEWPNLWGCHIGMTHPKKVNISIRAVLKIGMSNAILMVDDLQMQDEKECPPAPSPNPDPAVHPFDIIEAVYKLGQFDLSTHDGCGLFTEACCKALHQQQDGDWGHIKKTGAQNQFNGHAVDALMLLVGNMSAGEGIYDIVINSVSPEAKPAFIYVGPPARSLWYYPAAPL